MEINKAIQRIKKTDPERYELYLQARKKLIPWSSYRAKYGG